MEINPNIFRAYDIRGIYPSEINEKVAYLVGRAFVKFLGKSNPRIVVGRDNRPSSPALFKALTKGITDQGADVIDTGLSTTPMLYFSVAHFNFDGGIEISASHLPREWNGFKLVREKAIPISEKTGIQEIKNLVLTGGFKMKRLQPTHHPPKGRLGKMLKKKVLKEYIAFNLKDFNPKAIKPLKIVIDTANAVPGIVVPEIFQKTNCKIYHLYSKLDGSFPNHNPDPLIKANLKAICQTVKRKKADLGIAFDGDGDRVVFVDEKGEVVSGDLITALIADLILEKNPKEKILYDIRSSNILPETIKKLGGEPIMSRIGHSFIKEKMRRENIIFAGEFSGHYYLKQVFISEFFKFRNKQEHYFCEAPIFVLLKILETISKTGQSLSELIQPFKKYFHSGEINFRVENKIKILKTLEKKYKGGEISHLDGLRVDFKNWWFLARPSQTEPLLRLVLEAKTKKLLEKKKKELIVQIKSLS